MTNELEQEGVFLKERIDWEGVKAPEKVVCWANHKGPRLEVRLSPSLSLSALFLSSSNAILIMIVSFFLLLWFSDVALLRNLARFVSPSNEFDAPTEMKESGFFSLV